MRIRAVILAVAVTAVFGPVLASAPARALAAGRGVVIASGTWGMAKKAPGTARLNVDGNAAVLSVSCASAGNCSAGGYYRDGAAHQQAFVINQASGIWGAAKEVPDTAGLNAGGSAAVTTVSCAASGDCSAGGYYRDGTGHDQVFVVTQTNGIWGKAKEVPGTASLNAGGHAGVTSVSCAAAGSCSAGGAYDPGVGQQAFVVTQANGIWGTAVEVPGTASLNTGGNATISSLSCTAASDCSAGGSYNGGGGRVFVVTQANGTWGTAVEVPGTASLNTGGDAAVTSLSCAAAGKCSAGGYYNGGYQAFVVTER